MHARLTASALAAVALLCAGRGDAQQCALDPNRDGQTTINELVQAVGETLNGCPGSQRTPTRTPTRRPGTPTPTQQTTGRCPYDFNHDTGDGNFCSYVGTATSDSCTTESGLVAGWVTTGSSVVGIWVLSEDTNVALYGERTSGNAARITAWAVGNPNLGPRMPTSGSMSLRDPNRFTFGFDSGGRTCGIIQFAGNYFQLVGGGAGLVDAQGVAGEADTMELLDRLRESVAGARPGRAGLRRSLQERASQ